MSSFTPTHHTTIDDAARQVTAVVLQECAMMSASDRASVLARVLATVSTSSHSDILTPRSIAFITWQEAYDIIGDGALPC